MLTGTAGREATGFESDGAGDAVVGRYAPSPTGALHLGNLRTALLAWALARNAGGRFVLRMEDLDSSRVRPEYAARQLSDLEAIGLTWDGPVLWQSQNLERYRAAFDRLPAHATYECYCTRRELREIGQAPNHVPDVYPGTCRNLTAAQREEGREKLSGMNRGPAVRLRCDLDISVPGQPTLPAEPVEGVPAGGTRGSDGPDAAPGGQDLQAGPRSHAIEAPVLVRRLMVEDGVAGAYTGDVDDFVIRRGEGAFAYNFVSVVDDAAQGVTEVVRGNDLLPSTPRQVYLQRVLGLPTPAYIHVPMVENMAGIRLQKRDGAVTLADLAEFGWTPADVVNLLARSLGFEARSGTEFAAGLAEITADGVAALGTVPWRVDPADLRDGPVAALTR